MVHSFNLTLMIRCVCVCVCVFGLAYTPTSRPTDTAMSAAAFHHRHAQCGSLHTSRPTQLFAAFQVSW